MKIEISVKKKGEDYVLSTAYGKAPVFLIYDIEKDSFEIIKNEGLSGKSVAEDLEREGVEAVITNHIGSGAYNALVSKGIKAYFTELKNENWKKIIEEFKNGRLSEITPQNFYLIPQHKH